MAFEKHIKNRKNSQGFAILEGIVAVPVLFTIGAVVFMLLFTSMKIVADNNLSIKAANEAAIIMENVKNSTTCYELQSYSGSKQFGDEVPNKFTVKSELATVCVPGATTEFRITVTRDNDAKKLFSTATRVLIRE